MPPDVAKSTLPATFNLFSIPTPPSTIKAPVSLLVDSVVLLTKTESLIWVVPPKESRIRFPEVVLTVLVSNLILSNVPTPVTLKLLILTWESKVEIPDALNRLRFVDW